MRLGGFVIHGEHQALLGRCAASIAAVADRCVAVSTAGSTLAERVLRERGFEVLRRSWDGYGAARAAAVEELRDCDYVFFLDSDEWFEPEGIAQLRAWKASSPSAPYYTLRRRDWAQLGGRTFRYRTENHVRLVRRDAALWDRTMIVHEALPAANRVRLGIHLEHHFADDLDAMWAKAERYALLWAVRFCGDRRSVKPAALQLLAHLFRETILKGAIFRGGLPALRLAWVVAHHHARKYTLLGEVRRGAHADLSRAFEEGHMADLYRLLPAEEPVPTGSPLPAEATGAAAPSSRRVADGGEF
jgi:glycosyltransferase involved in cell wall biosynthesis